MHQAVGTNSDPRRTRRNVIATAGIIASTLVTSSFLAKKASAHHHDRDGDRDGDGDRGRNCFLSGTHIRTEVGEIAVEKLRAGDMVPTISGQTQAIRRIHSWEAEREPNQYWTGDVAPIKVCRSALALNVPQRDLYLSPLHALYFDGVLITVGALVNGLSIVRCSSYEADSLSYFHLELEDHQVIFAEGTPVEFSA